MRGCERGATIAAGAGGLTYLVGRGCFEGDIDTGHADRGDVIPSDVWEPSRSGGYASTGRSQTER